MVTGKNKVSKKSKESKSMNLIPRETPPIFPMGFRFGIGDDICIVDFMDTPDESTIKASHSIALTKKHAKQIIEGLSNFVGDES